MNSKRMKNTRLFGTLAGLLIAAAMTVGSSAQEPVADWFVDGATGDDDNDGDLWSVPFETLFKALESSFAGDVIFVAKGTYYPDDGTGNPDDRDATYDMIADVAVYGGFLNGDDFEDRNIVANETILSGAIGTGAHTDNSKHVVTFDNLTGDDPILDGFTVSDGHTDAMGGGIWVDESTEAFVSNCLLRDNVAQTGGGVGANDSANDLLQIRNCQFQDNSAVFGGGIALKFSNDTVLNVINCDFSDNLATSNGGGLYATSDGDITVVNTTFTGNTADDDGGGAFFSTSPNTLFINCLFDSNTAGRDGGAVLARDSSSSVDFDNCTFSENHALDDGGGIVGVNSIAITITNGILWGNTDVDTGTDTEDAQILMLSSATVTVKYTCIEGCDDFCDVPADNNIDDDPLFVDPGTNYRLAAGSPCIDAADNDAVPCDEFDVDEDGDDCTAPAQDTPDLDFGARRIDDPDITDTGNGTAPIVDMGAYESVPCPWDLDGNCSVGVGDLLILLANWGNPYGVPELLLLLAAWGPSCQCDPNAEVLSLEDELDDACLSQDDWDEYEDVMTDSESSQADKDRYDCWMTHYILHCDKCSCEDIPTCPTPDPFN